MSPTAPGPDPSRSRRVRSTRTVIVCIALAAASVLGLAATTCWYAPWPPGFPPGPALGRVLDREGHLPDGAVWRADGIPMDLRVFGVEDPRAQDEIAARAEEVLRRFGKRGEHKIEFWSGPAPPVGPYDERDLGPEGGVLLREIRVTR